MGIFTSERGLDWEEFSIKVLHHIEDYAVPQYGDKGSDQCTEFTIQDFQTQIKKYANRMGRNSRHGQDKLDLLKMAHYCQMLHDILDINIVKEDLGNCPICNEPIFNTPSGTVCKNGHGGV